MSTNNADALISSVSRGWSRRGSRGGGGSFYPPPPLPPPPFWDKIISFSWIFFRKIRKNNPVKLTNPIWKRSGSVVECLTWDREAAGSSLTGSLRCGTWARHIYPSLALVQPRKTRPCLTERLLMGPKESNQTKLTNRTPPLSFVKFEPPSMKSWICTCCPLSSFWVMNALSISDFQHFYPPMWNVDKI